jgi:hypothetical protein
VARVAEGAREVAAAPGALAATRRRRVACEADDCAKRGNAARSSSGRFDLLHSATAGAREERRERRLPCRRGAQRGFGFGGALALHRSTKLHSNAHGARCKQARARREAALGSADGCALLSWRGLIARCCFAADERGNKACIASSRIATQLRRDELRAHRVKCSRNEVRQ